MRSACAASVGGTSNQASGHSDAVGRCSPKPGRTLGPTVAGPELHTHAQGLHYSLHRGRYPEAGQQAGRALLALPGAISEGHSRRAAAAHAAARARIAYSFQIAAHRWNSIRSR
jgi:hypothetical protein